MTVVQGFGDKVGFIWSVADLLRGDFKAHEYGQVILPFTVLRRLECVLAPTKDAVLKRVGVPHREGGERRPHPPARREASLLQRQPAEFNVAFFFKQWGGRTPKAGGRLLDDRTWDELPHAREHRAVP